jgi:hypothetical protein
LSIEGRAVPDYGAPFNFFCGAGTPGAEAFCSAGILPASFIFEKFDPEPAGRRRYGNQPLAAQKTIHIIRVQTFVCFP